ncbi:C-type lectin domain family 4 member K-like isoform X2 [Ostrea edulis]|nr:C-type lectin domain family 4 member K-like isoform X2 [Ostrea edulis]
MTMLTSAHFETSCTKMGCSITKYQSTRRPGPVIPKPKGCRKGWKEYNGHCYKQPSIPLNWFNAQMYCRKHGAHLAKVDDESENYWISRAFPLKKWYTDFTDLGKEGVWKSFTFGDEAVYTNWIKGNPSNSNSREHCVEINCEYLGLWNDVPCEAVLKFVCESYGYME